jgi:hypothetical protein
MRFSFIMITGYHYPLLQSFPFLRPLLKPHARAGAPL